MKSRHSLLLPSFSGFSLVEVVIAIGLLSFAVLSIVGLLPVGMSSLRQSMNQTVETQIVRSISGQSVVGNFSTLATNGIYFDGEGQHCEIDRAAYTVNIATNTPSFPGSTNAANLPGCLTTLKVEIIYKPTATASAAASVTNRYTLQVANSGK